MSGKTITVDVLDTAGYDFWPSFYDNLVRKADGILFVYDITDSRYFDELDLYLENIERVKKTAKYVVCGNKCDLESKRKVPTSEGEKFAKKLGCPFFETSAKEAINVEEAFMCLIEDCFYGSNDNNANPENEESQSKCIIC